jgi:ubiquinone biosynthesis UbiH/UbiF/VisC/COQ6 family hydroxylase
MNATHDIVVVGGGPVGAATALALRAAGFDVALAERGPPPAYDPNDYDLRVYAISPQSAALLDRVGVWESIAAKRASAYSAMHVWEDGVARGLSFDAADAGLPQLGWIVEHGLIVAELWSRFGNMPVYRGVDIVSAEFGESASRLHLADGRTLASRLVIAADGADSKLRGLAGIDTVGWKYEQRAIVCHVRTEKPHRATAWQRFLRTGPLAFLPLADGRSSIVWSAEEPLASELLALDDVMFRARLAESSEYALGDVLETTRRVVFPLRLQHANDYVRPGIALIGDAAHTVHPLAGQGVNLGFGDVRALATILGEARDAGREWSASRTLARYQRARKADNVEMLAMTDALYRAHRVGVPGLRAVLGLGLDAVDRVGVVKGWLARRAVGAGKV